MAFYYVVSSSDAAVTGGDMPPTGGIENALNAAALPAGASWPRPQSRIVRTNALFSLSGYGTSVARLLAVDAPDQASADAVAAQAQPAAQAALDGMARGTTTSGWTPVAVVPFTSGTNGPYAAWSDPGGIAGDAFTTRTRDTAPEPFDTSVENPLGPSTPANTPASLLEPLTGGAHDAGLLPSLEWFLVILGVVVAGGVALWYALPWIAGRGGRRAHAAIARENPRRGSRRRRRDRRRDRRRGALARR